MLQTTVLLTFFILFTKIFNIILIRPKQCKSVVTDHPFLKDTISNHIFAHKLFGSISKKSIWGENPLLGKHQKYFFFFIFQKLFITQNQNNVKMMRFQNFHHFCFQKQVKQK